MGRDQSITMKSKTIAPKLGEIREDKTKKGASRESVKVTVGRREDKISEDRNRWGQSCTETVNLA